MHSVLHTSFAEVQALHILPSFAEVLPSVLEVQVLHIVPSFAEVPSSVLEVQALHILPSFAEVPSSVLEAAAGTVESQAPARADIQKATVLFL